MIKKNLLVLLNLFALTNADAGAGNNSTDATAPEVGNCSGCELYVETDKWLQGNLTALATLEDAVTTCEADAAAAKAAEEAATNPTETEEEEESTPSGGDQGGQGGEQQNPSGGEQGGQGGEQQNPSGGEQSRIRRLNTQLNGEEDPCKTEKDALAAEEFTADIDGVTNVGLTSNDTAEITRELIAQKRIFLLSKVKPNADASGYKVFMDDLTTQKGHWDHAHDEDEHAHHEDATKADGLADKAIADLITYINDTILVENATIVHADYQTAYKQYKQDVIKATEAILDVLIAVEDDAANKAKLEELKKKEAEEAEAAKKELEEHVAAQGGEGGSSTMIIVIVALAVLVVAFLVYWFYCRDKEDEKKD